MNGIVEWVVGVVDALRRRSASVWVWRLALLGCGAATQLWILALRPFVLLAALGAIAVCIAVVSPRGVMPVVAGALLIAEAASIGVTVPEAVPVAIGLVGWHVCATALSAGRPWSRFSPSVWRGFAPLAALGIAGAVIAVPLVLGAQLLTLPPAALVTLGLVLLACVGGMVVVWPSAGAERPRATRRY